MEQGGGAPAQRGVRVLLQLHQRLEHLPAEVRVRVTVRVRVRVTFTVRVTFRVRVTVRAGIDHLEVGLHPPREEVSAAKHALERPVLKVLVRVRVEVGVRRWN